MELNKKSRTSPDTWKLNTTLLNTPYINEEFSKEI
jgi:hypothetical protein